MKRIIEIPDKVYNRIKSDNGHGYCTLRDQDERVIVNAICNAQAAVPERPQCNQIAWEQGYEAGLAQGKQGRLQGEWIDEGQYAEGYSEHAYICKNCGYQIIEKPNMIFENRFCKYCGAKMKGRFVE